MKKSLLFVDKIFGSLVLSRLAFITLLTGCAAGPDFVTPQPPPVQTYTASNLPAQTASAPDQLGHAQRFVEQTEIDARWWEQFGSPRLNSLIVQGLRSSPTLAAAQATLRQSEELFNAQAGSTQYPQAAVTLGAARERFNGSGFGQRTSNTFDLYNASVGVTYNFDLAGGNRRILEALAAQVDYQRFQLEAARLTLAANLVTGAITQAQLATQIQALEDILSAQTEQFELSRQREALGNASAVEVLSLQTQMEQTRAGIIPVRNRLEQTGHLISVLVGRPPGAAGMPQFVLTEFTLPGELPMRVPSELVRQRPDIQASEALLHAANAQYGESISHFYPQLTLSANLGSLTNTSLFGPGSAVWGLAGQVVQPLFNAGLKPASRAAKANMNAAAANYQQTVLQALRNVADVLRAIDNDAVGLQAQAVADSAAQQSLKLAQQQYRLGTISYIQLLVAQQQARQIRYSLLAAQAQRLTDCAALYLSMGVGEREKK